MEAGRHRPFGAEWWDNDGRARLPVRGVDGGLQDPDEARAEEARVDAAKQGLHSRPYHFPTVEERDADAEGSADASVPQRSPQSSKGNAEGDSQKRGTTSMSFEAWRQLPKAERLRLRERRKLQIADLAQYILQSPDKTIPSRGGKKSVSQELHGLCHDPDPTIRQLTMLSELAVFRDVVPGYRIRVRTEKEKAQQVSKEVKRVWKFEEAVVKNYQRYLQFLEETLDMLPSRKDRRMRHIRGEEADPDGPAGDAGDASEDFRNLPWNARKAAERRREQARKAPSQAFQAFPRLRWKLGLAALDCLCELLVSLSHFNYRSNLVALLVPRADSADAPVADRVCGALRRLFRADAAGAATAEVVEAMAQRIRGRGAKVRPALVRALCSLRIREDLVQMDKRRRTEKALKEAAPPHIRRKQEKEAKEARKNVVSGPGGTKGGDRGETAVENEEELRKVMETADAEDTKKRVESEGKTLRAAIQICFRLLRAPNNAKVLPAVLEGLGNLVHLIDVQTAEDVVISLRRLMEEATEMGTGALGGQSEDGLDWMAGEEFDGQADGNSSDASSSSSSSSSSSGASDAVGATVDSQRVVRPPRRKRHKEQKQSGGRKPRGRRNRRGKETRSRAEQRRLMLSGVMGASGIPVNLPTGLALQLVLTGLRILHGPGKVLNMDEADFSLFLYRILLRLVLPEGRRHLPVALDAMTQLLLKRREHDTDRVAAFAKRCLMIAPQLPQHGCVAVMAFTRRAFFSSSCPLWFCHYPCALVICVERSSFRLCRTVSSIPASDSALGLRIRSGYLWSVSVREGTWGSRLDGGELNQSNGLSTVAWELHLLSKYFNPYIGRFSRDTARMVPMGASEVPSTLYRSFDPSSGGFNPSIADPPPDTVRERFLRDWERAVVKASEEAGGARGADSEYDDSLAASGPSDDNGESEAAACEDDRRFLHLDSSHWWPLPSPGNSSMQDFVVEESRDSPPLPESTERLDRTLLSLPETSGLHLHDGPILTKGEPARAQVTEKDESATRDPVPAGNGAKKKVSKKRQQFASGGESSSGTARKRRRKR